MGTKINGVWSFDVTDWKPVTPSSFIELMGQCSTTMDYPPELIVKVEHLSKHRVRVVFMALVKHEATEETPPTSGVEPFLMTIYDQGERAKHLHFVRTNVDLCIE